jgi:hypothetical protein
VSDYESATTAITTLSALKEEVGVRLISGTDVINQPAPQETHERGVKEDISRRVQPLNRFQSTHQVLMFPCMDRDRRIFVCHHMFLLANKMALDLRDQIRQQLANLFIGERLTARILDAPDHFFQPKVVRVDFRNFDTEELHPPELYHVVGLPA